MYEYFAHTYTSTCTLNVDIIYILLYITNTIYYDVKTFTRTLSCIHTFYIYELWSIFKFNILCHNIHILCIYIFYMYISYISYISYLYMTYMVHNDVKNMHKHLRLHSQVLYTRIMVNFQKKIFVIIYIFYAYIYLICIYHI